MASFILLPKYANPYGYLLWLPVTCGYDSNKAFEVLMQGKRHVFDSFECALQALAPRCAHCNTRIIGHGVEDDGHYFCCAHCAEQNGVTALKDRVH